MNLMCFHPYRYTCTAAAYLAIVGSSVFAAPPKLPRAAPDEVGMSADVLKEIDEVAEEGIAAGEMPGCVVAIVHGGKLALLKAYGHRSTEPSRQPMTTDTVFDLASLTKPIATATSIMLLHEQGKVQLDEPVASYWPDFTVNGKEAITIRELLTHQGGLIADNSMRDYADGADRSMQRIAALKASAAPRKKFIYSDVGFIVLAEVVRRVSGTDVAEFSRQQIFQPLGMDETGYLPTAELQERSAPTEQRNGAWMQGTVHDPRAHALGGVAGHAGLFSTAEDLAVLAQMLLARGEYQKVRVLKAETVELMTTPHEVPGGGKRGLGWDMQTGYSSNRGQNFSDSAFGHGGFTGMALWIDPDLDLAVIFLSNRLHPDGKGSVNPLARRIGTIAADAIRRGAGSRAGDEAR